MKVGFPLVDCKGTPGHMAYVILDIMVVWASDLPFFAMVDLGARSTDLLCMRRSVIWHGCSQAIRASPEHEKNEEQKGSHSPISP